MNYNRYKIKCNKVYKLIKTLVYLNTRFQIVLKNDTAIEQKAYKKPSNLYVIIFFVWYCF